jgi:hypothetical protein
MSHRIAWKVELILPSEDPDLIEPAWIVSGPLDAYPLPEPRCPYCGDDLGETE